MDTEAMVETTNPRAAACPACGGATGLERDLHPDLGPLSLDELETLARNEWRRRLGPQAYARRHSRVLVRALIVYALAPDSPVRQAVVDQLIWWEVAELGSWGLSRHDLRREFVELAAAVRDVLSRAEPEGEGHRTLPERIAARLEVALA